jgi:uncharacterized protein YndB with AHSA1/START domain
MYLLDNSMTSKPLVTERVFNLPLDTVWQSLTNKNALREWYFTQLEDVKPIPGFEFKFTDDGSAFQKEWRVTQVAEAQKFAHTWAYKGYTGLSEVSFELFAESGKTKLRITHTGLESFSDDPHFARNRFAWGWEYIGNKLDEYLKKAESAIT